MSDSILLLPPGSTLTDTVEAFWYVGSPTCPDEVHTRHSGDLEALWERLLERQPHSPAYLDWPMTRMTDFYYMRLLITLTGC